MAHGQRPKRGQEEEYIPGLGTGFRIFPISSFVCLPFFSETNESTDGKRRRADGRWVEQVPRVHALVLVSNLPDYSLVGQTSQLSSWNTSQKTRLNVCSPSIRPSSRNPPEWSTAVLANRTYKMDIRFACIYDACHPPTLSTPLSMRSPPLRKIPSPVRSRIKSSRRNRGVSTASYPHSHRHFPHPRGR